MDIVGVFADAGDIIAVRKKPKENLFIATVFFFHAWPYIPATTLSKQWTSIYPVYDVFQRCTLG